MSTEYRINYFEQIKFYYSVVFANQLDIRPVHTSLYMFLLNQNNRINWVEWFKCPYDMGMVGAQINSKNTYYKALDDLVSFKLIEYEKGINLHKAPKIKIVPANSTVSKIDTLTAPLCEKVDDTLSSNLTGKLHDTLSSTLNDNIYKLITNNIKTINLKQETVVRFLEGLIYEEEKKEDFVMEIPLEIPKRNIYQEIIEVYHLLCTTLPKVIEISDTRKKAIDGLVKNYGYEKIGDVFKMTSESDFLSGRSDKDFKASFDWITKKANFIKILEGNYNNNKKNGQQKSTAEQFRDAYNSEAARNFKFS